VIEFEILDYWHKQQEQAETVGDHSGVDARWVIVVDGILLSIT
jgi:hypothetical protein